MIGTIIDGAYEVEEFLGEGSFGIVYRCRDLPLGRYVAVKLLNAAATTDREAKRFASEARNMASLSHPNVVQIFRLGTHEGSPYIAMEYLSGKTLSEFARKHRLGVRRSLEIMRDVAAGLQGMHNAGIVHRDLSPKNIFVTDKGRAKILDLGLSKDLGDLSQVSTQNYLVGTLAYVAPEQIEGRTTEFRSEVFSFGIILYELLTGMNPFRAEHHMSLLYNIANQPPDPLEKHLPDCPPQLSLFVMRCLEKIPERRPADMAEIERILAAILEATASNVTSTSPVSISGGNAVVRTSTRNPYLNRVMIRRRDDFFGRTQEIRRMFARLNASPPGSVSVVGDRKIGKSSLLNHVYSRQSRLEHLEQPDHMVMVFLDLQEEKNMSMAALVGKLLGVAALELRGRLDVTDCAPNLDGIKTLVQRLDEAGFRLALLLDEFDSVTTNANFDLEFFSFLRFLANHYNVAYITSSARDLQTLCHTQAISDSPFFNIFSTMRLSVFTLAEAEELIRVPSERVGKPLHSYRATILDMAGLFPFFLQMACSHVLDWMDENPPAAEPDFAAIRKRFYDEAVFHYRAIWDGFDAHERSALRRVAEGRNIPDALRHVLDELANKHYIETADGKMRLFSTAFVDFVRSLPDHASQRSFLRRWLGG